MPAVELLLPTSPVSSATSKKTNPLPSLLQTPSGLAILEIQGTIHAPFQNALQSSTPPETTHQIGRLEFPLYNASISNDDGKWMKKVYLYVGKHQRLTGEVKKLAKPLGVIRKVDQARTENGNAVGSDEGETLEIVDIVKFKVSFSGRPEPVGE